MESFIAERENIKRIEQLLAEAGPIPEKPKSKLQ
jgi:hypothetical protein